MMTNREVIIEILIEENKPLTIVDIIFIARRKNMGSRTFKIAVYELINRLLHQGLIIVDKDSTDKYLYIGPRSGVQKLKNLQNLIPINNKLYILGFMGFVGEVGEVTNELMTLVLPEAKDKKLKKYLSKIVKYSEKIDTMKKEMRRNQYEWSGDVFIEDKAKFMEELSDVIFCLQTIFTAVNVTYDEVAEMAYHKAVSRKVDLANEKQMALRDNLLNITELQ